MYKIALCILGLTASCQAGSLSDALIKSFANGEEKDVILEFPSVINAVMSNPQLSGLSGSDRSNMIVNLMQASTSASQAPVLNALGSLGFSDDQVTPFWVDNKVAIKGAGLGPLQALAAVPGPFTIREAYQAKVYPAVEVKEQRVSLRQSADPPQWGVAKINAPSMWDAGFRGEGIVVGIIDTGVNINHIALKDNYKNDQYSWKDGFKEHETPYDGNGHGTHCAGTIAGNVNGIGVAPDAKYMACRGLDDKGSGNEISLTACGQFMACPSGNSSSNCTGMPNIVSNSWGGLIGGQTWFDNTIKLWNSMGIIGFFAIGNSGQFGCFTAGSPGDRPGVISVGSTDDKDVLSYFSSKGPPLKSLLTTVPTIAAPGSNIVSALFNTTDGYITLSGTSMATPHAAGAAALLLSAHPKWKLADMEKAFRTTTVQKKLNLFDGPSVCYLPSYPNNAYGSGRIDVFKAKDAKV